MDDVLGTAPGDMTWAQIIQQGGSALAAVLLVAVVVLWRAWAAERRERLEEGRRHADELDRHNGSLMSLATASVQNTTKVEATLSRVTDVLERLDDSVRDLEAGRG